MPETMIVLAIIPAIGAGATAIMDLWGIAQRRLLGIPAVIDRVVDQAAAQVFMPHWEPRFSSRSFAYRPGRGPHDALDALEKALNRGAQWALHLDIENFFDSVPHRAVLGGLEKDLADRRLAALLDRVLTCGVFQGGLVRPTQVGLAQGSPLSPLLANVVLHRLDTRLEEQEWEFVRYADDCCVLMAGEDGAERAKQTIAGWLAEIGLRINEQKTAFGHFTTARFLGFAFRRDGNGRVVRYASPESVAEAEVALVSFVKTAGGDPHLVASEVSQMLRSWLAYFHSPADEARLRTFAERITAAWRERFSTATQPDCLRWETLVGRGGGSRRMDYSGHLRDAFSFLEAVDWTESLRCIAQRLLRSRWWGVDYDIGLGQRAPMLRLRLGPHRIGLRF